MNNQDFWHTTKRQKFVLWKLKNLSSLNKFLADHVIGKTSKQTENYKKPVTQRFLNTGLTPYLKTCIVILSISNGSTYVYVATLITIHTLFYFWMFFNNEVCCKYVFYAYISSNNCNLIYFLWKTTWHCISCESFCPMKILGWRNPPFFPWSSKPTI